MVWTIRPDAVAQALAALGATAGDGPLATLRDWFELHGRDPGQANKDAGAPIDF